MAGDGPQRDAWRRLSPIAWRRRRDDGWVDEATAPAVYSAGAAIAVVPSLWPEPFGLVGLDAAALGRPAVAFDVGGIGEWLEEGRNGRLVEPARARPGWQRRSCRCCRVPPSAPAWRKRRSPSPARLTVAAHVNRLEPLLHAGWRDRGIVDDPHVRVSAGVRRRRRLHCPGRRRAGRGRRCGHDCLSTAARRRRRQCRAPSSSLLLDDSYGRSSRREPIAGPRQPPFDNPRPVRADSVRDVGANLPFCRWLLRRASRGRDDVRVMFHEPYFEFGWAPMHRSALSIVQRRMARIALARQPAHLYARPTPGAAT